MFRVALVATLFGLALSGFCPPGQVPVGVNVTDTGLPDIMCQKPVCYLQSDRMYPCSYYESQCGGHTTWVAGIHPTDELKMACCESAYMAHSRLIGQTTLSKGDSFTGGYFNDEAGKEGFDAIFNFETKGGDYKVTVTRITCPSSDIKMSPSALIKPQHDTAGLPGIAGNLQKQPMQNYGLQFPFANDDEQTIIENYEKSHDQMFMQEPLGAHTYMSESEPIPSPSKLGGLSPLGMGNMAMPGLGSMACFSQDTNVQTEAEGPKQMKDIKIGDNVLSIVEGRYTFAPVTSFLHRYEDREADFLDVQYGERKLTLTPHHFIYTVPCDSPNRRWEMKYARDIVVGKDCLLRVEGDQVAKMTHKLTPVDSITPVVRRGVYGPLTSTGQIVVNEVVASCHAVVKDGVLLLSLMDMAQTMEGAIDQVKSWMGYTNRVHADTLHEMPHSLESLMHFADGIFPTNWKSISQH